MRASVIDEHLRGEYSEKYFITEVEFICLQFQKIFEKIAITSLVANIEEYAKVRKQYASDYDPIGIINGLRKGNLYFYPKPSMPIIKEDGTSHFEPITDGFLTEDDLTKAWKKCSNIIHAENPYNRPHNYENVQSMFPDWLTKIVVLLNHHSIVVNNDYMLTGSMRWCWDRDTNERPHVAGWDKVGPIIT